MSYRPAEPFLTAKELVLGKISHRGIGLAESVHLAEKIREAGRPRLTNLLNGVLMESCGRERLARIREGRKGTCDPSRLREPSDEFDAVESQVPRRLISVREALSDEDRGAGPKNAADL